MIDWIAPSTVALGTIDMQRTFCPANNGMPEGKLPVQGGHEIIPLVNKNNRHFRKRFFTKDAHCQGHKSFASSHPGKKPFEVIWMLKGKEVPKHTEGAIEQTLWTDHGIKGTKDGDFHPDLEIPEDAWIIKPPGRFLLRVF